jgi:hypothetical protein
MCVPRSRGASDSGRSGGPTVITRPTVIGREAWTAFLKRESRECTRIDANRSVRRDGSTRNEPGFFSLEQPLGILLVASRAAVPPKIPARWGEILSASSNDSRSFARIRGIRDNESRPSLPTDYRRTPDHRRTRDRDA